MEELIQTLRLIYGWEHVGTDRRSLQFAPRPKVGVPVVRGLNPIRLQPVQMGPVLHFRIPLEALIQVRHDRIRARLNALINKGLRDVKIERVGKELQFHKQARLLQKIKNDRNVLRRFRAGVMQDMSQNALDLYEGRLNPEGTPENRLRLTAATLQIGEEEGIPMAYLSVGLLKKHGEEMPKKGDAEGVT